MPVFLPVSVKFSSVIHLTVDNYYLRGFGLISISVSLWQVFPWGKKKLHKRLYALPGILAYSSSALCLHHGFVHGSIHLFVALPISMVQEGLRKRLILPGGQYPDHVLHSFAGPAPPLPFHAILRQTRQSVQSFPEGGGFAALLDDGILVSQPSPRGEGAP